MATKTYDSGCYELAKRFLQEEPCAADPVLFEKHCDALAREIQHTIEDFCFEEEV